MVARELMKSGGIPAFFAGGAARSVWYFLIITHQVVLCLFHFLSNLRNI
jgi:hypothetical protein